MKRYLMLVATFATLTVVGCSSPQVVAEATFTDEATGEQRPVSEMPVRLLPYDRDAIFDSLQQAYSEPEPPIPSELLALQDSVTAAETAWRLTVPRDSIMRDSVTAITAELEQLRTAGQTNTPAYRTLFATFQRVEATAETVNQEMQQAFEHFDSMQQMQLEAAETVRVARDMWAEQAFADFEAIVAAKLDESGHEELADTTDANGVATFLADDGQWWLYARYTMPFEEMYWNVPVDVTGDSVHVELNPANAELRPIL